MKNTGTIDLRLLKVSQLLERFVNDDFTGRESFSDEGDEIDNIIKQLNALGEKILVSGKVIKDYEVRVAAIMNVLLKYTFFDFDEKAVVTQAGDEIDAIALALNTLGEELGERIESEKKHTQELEKLAAVIETTADAVVSMTPEGLITHWNKSAERIYGYTAEEMVGKRSEIDFTPASERSAVMQTLAEARTGKQVVNVNSVRRRKDGKVIDISITITPIYDVAGNLDSLSGLSRDVTDQRKAQEVLKESEEKFRNLVEGVKDYAIITLDAGGHITSWNEGAEAIKGYRESEAIGKHFSLFYTKADRESHLPDKIINEAIVKGKANYEGYRVRKDGSTFWGNVVITCLRDENNKIKGFSKITRDLSESKRKDDEISKYTLRLEQKNIELEKINKELSSFAYVSSHDLQEPLRKIQTFANRILETDFGNLSTSGKDYFRRMEASANRMQQLILDILHYSRLNTTDQERETIDLQTLVAEVLQEFKEDIENKKGKVSVGALCKISIIPYQFKQLMNNLISNAIKFSSPVRPLEIKIKSEIISKKKLKEDLNPNFDKYCHLSVQDNGIGFEPHFSVQIFEVFQRLHNQSNFPGTGIGLAICKKIVENHNGHIVASGELGKGARFDIYLPA